MMDIGAPLNWRREVAGLAIGVIEGANYGRWPESVDDWGEVCRRLDVALLVTDARTTSKGTRAGDVIVVKRGRNTRTTCSRIAHEVAECVLTTECEAPYHYIPTPGVSESRERHRVARLVEREQPARSPRSSRGRRLVRASADDAETIYRKILQRYRARKIGSHASIMRSDGAQA